MALSTCHCLQIFEYTNSECASEMRDNQILFSTLKRCSHSLPMSSKSSILTAVKSIDRPLGTCKESQASFKLISLDTVNTANHTA